MQITLGLSSSTTTKIRLVIDALSLEGEPQLGHYDISSDAKLVQHFLQNTNFKYRDFIVMTIQMDLPQFQLECKWSIEAF